MSNKSSSEFTRFFLIEFTKELIRNYGPIYQLRAMLQQEEKEKKVTQKEKLKQKIKSQIQEKELKKTQTNQNLSQPSIEQTIQKNFAIRFPVRRRVIAKPPVLRIPEIKLPANLRYLKPIPEEKLINLGKLNPLIQDPQIKEIHCEGPGRYIKVVKFGGKVSQTTIILTKEEIDSILKTFSKESKIPLQEGIFKVAVGKLTISAIVSQTIGSKFIIKKISPTQNIFPM